MVLHHPGSRSCVPKPVDWSRLLEQMTLIVSKGGQGPVRGVTPGDH